MFSLFINITLLSIAIEMEGDVKRETKSNYNSRPKRELNCSETNYKQGQRLLLEHATLSCPVLWTVNNDSRAYISRQ